MMAMPAFAVVVQIVRIQIIQFKICSRCGSKAGPIGQGTAALECGHCRHPGEQMVWTRRVARDKWFYAAPLVVRSAPA